MSINNEGDSYNDVKSDILHILSVGGNVLLYGHPGYAKSALAADLAKSLGLPLVYIFLSQMDYIEFHGAQMPDLETVKMVWCEPTWFPKQPSFIFLDEINIAAISKTYHLGVACRLVFDKKIGPHELPEGSVVMAAGNLPEDGEFVVKLSPMINNRFAHIILRTDALEG